VITFLECCTNTTPFSSILRIYQYKSVIKTIAYIVLLYRKYKTPLKRWGVREPLGGMGLRVYTQLHRRGILKRYKLSQLDTFMLDTALFMSITAEQEQDS